MSREEDAHEGNDELVEGYLSTGRQDRAVPRQGMSNSDKVGLGMNRSPETKSQDEVIDSLRKREPDHVVEQWPNRQVNGMVQFSRILL